MPVGAALSLLLETCRSSLNCSTGSDISVQNRTLTICASTLLMMSSEGLKRAQAGWRTEMSDITNPLLACCPAHQPSMHSVSRHHPGDGRWRKRCTLLQFSWKCRGLFPDQRMHSPRPSWRFDASGSRTPDALLITEAPTRGIRQSVA